MPVTISGTSGITTPGISSTAASTFSAASSFSEDLTLAGAGVQVLNNSGRIVLNQAGSVIQVVSTTKTDTFSTTSTSYADITGLSVSITPSSATSKIYVVAQVTGGGTPGTNNTNFRLVRDSTAICIGTSGGGSRIQSTTSATPPDGNALQSLIISFLDSPATTSATTYKIQQIVPSGTGYVNRTSSDLDASYIARATSTITVMEIAA